MADVLLTARVAAIATGEFTLYHNAGDVLAGHRVAVLRGHVPQQQTAQAAQQSATDQSVNIHVRARPVSPAVTEQRVRVFRSTVPRGYVYLNPLTIRSLGLIEGDMVDVCVVAPREVRYGEKGRKGATLQSIGAVASASDLQLYWACASEGSMCVDKGVLHSVVEECSFGTPDDVCPEPEYRTSMPATLTDEQAYFLQFVRQCKDVAYVPKLSSKQHGALTAKIGKKERTSRRGSRQRLAGLSSPLGLVSVNFCWTIELLPVRLGLLLCPDAMEVVLTIEQYVVSVHLGSSAFNPFSWLPWSVHSLSQRIVPENLLMRRSAGKSESVSVPLHDPIGLYAEELRRRVEAPDGAVVEIRFQFSNVVTELDMTLNTLPLMLHENMYESCGVSAAVQVQNDYFTLLIEANSKRGKRYIVLARLPFSRIASVVQVQSNWRLGTNGFFIPFSGSETGRILLQRLQQLQLRGIEAYMGNVMDPPKHTIPPVMFELPLCESGDHPCTRVAAPKQIKNSRMFLLKALLSPQECSHYIAKAEQAGMRNVQWEYAPSYRRCDRVVFKSRELASRLWERIKPQLRREDVYRVRPFGFHHNGTWRPVGVNHCIRFTRYVDQDHFQPHRDGSFVRTDEHRSIYTVMVYLNEGYGGGKTAFYRPASKNRVGNTLGCYGKEAFSIEGQTGLGLCFTHDVWHAGMPVTSGVKYIMRTDLMFERISIFDELSWKSAVASNEFESDPRFVEAEELYQQSIRLQQEGEPARSTECYLRALDIQAELPSVSMDVPESLHLPLDLWRVILQYLTPKDVLNFGAAWKPFHYIALEGGVWRELFRRRWPELVSGQFPNDEVLVDWYRAYKQRAMACDLFDVYSVDVGAAGTRCCLVSGQPAHRAPVNTTHIAKAAGHYWGARSGHSQYFVGAEVGTFTKRGSRGTRLPQYLYDEPPPAPVNIHVLTEMVKWLAYRGVGAGNMEFECRGHPLLVCTAPYWTREEVERIRASMYQLGFPYVATIPSPCVTLLGMGKCNGLVVDGGAGCTFVCPVRDKKIEKHALRTLSVCDKTLPYGPRKEVSEESYFDEDPGRDLCALALDAVQSSRAPNDVLECVVICGGMSRYFRDRFTRCFPALCERNGLPQPCIEAVEHPEFAVISGAQAFASTPLAVDSFQSAIRDTAVGT